MLKAEKIGRLTSAFVSIAICALFILPVSAQYVDMLDHGLYYTNSYYPYTLKDSGGAGSGISDSVSLVPMWALDGYDMGKTYTFVFSCTLASGVYNRINKSGIYLNTSNKPRTSVVQAEHLSKAYRSISYDTSSKTITFTVKLNTDIVDLGGYPIYIYFYAPFTDGTNFVTVTTNSWSTYVETDAGGSQYVQDLVDIVGQMKQNNENYYSNALEVLDSIKSGVDNLPENIHDVLTQVDKEEKSEASTEGNDNITQATSALTNALPIASIKDAITPLITACSYNGITSVWSFPALKIPAIQGLFGEMQLSEQQNFDLCAYADQYIPDELLSIIRAVMTILLIVWAIREVMNLLSHLLGGGDG